MNVSIVMEYYCKVEAKNTFKQWHFHIVILGWAFGYEGWADPEVGVLHSTLTGVSFTIVPSFVAGECACKRF